VAFPTVETAMDELISVISDKTVCFGDESLKVPKLSGVKVKNSVDVDVSRVAPRRSE